MTANEEIEGQGVRAWRELVCENFIRLSLRHVELLGNDRIVACERGGVHVGRVRSGPQSVVRTQADVRKGSEEYAFMNLQVCGTCKAEQNGRQVVLEAGDLSLFDSISPYALNFDAPFEQLVVHVPRAWLTRFGSDIGAMSARRIRPATSIGDLLATGMHVLEGAISGVNDEAACAMANATLLMSIAALTANPAESVGTKASAQHTYFRALAIIERYRCDRRVTPVQVAKLVGCSLRHLQGVFNDRGSTIDGAIWNARLRLASEMLIRDRQCPITKIAWTCGFTSPSHFSASFRDLFDASPTEWRRRCETSRGCTTLNSSPSPLMLDVV